MFFDTPSPYTTDDIESQISQHSSTRSFHVPSRTHNMTDDIETQYPDTHNSTQIFPPQHTTYNLANQYSSTQIFERHPNLDQNLSYILSQRQRSIGNSESQYCSTQNVSMPSQKDYTVDDIESQYLCSNSSIQNFKANPDTLPLSSDVLPNSFEAPGTHSDIPLLSKFLAILKPPSWFSNWIRTPIAYPDLDPHPSNDFDNSNNKNMWQCIPSATGEDLEGGKPGCYHWNHEDVSVCYSCKQERVKETRSSFGALKRALGFRK